MPREDDFVAAYRRSTDERATLTYHAGRWAGRIVVAALVAVIVLLAGCDNVDPSYMREEVDGQLYEIKSAGADLRVYEWTSPITGAQCVFVAGTQKGGLQCFPGR